MAKVFYKADEEFMRKAMQVVKKNLDNPEFSVEVLASEMNMSRSNLHLRCTPHRICSAEWARRPSYFFSHSKE